MYNSNMEDDILDYKITKQVKNKDFDSLFKSLGLRSEETLKALFFITAKLAYWRENRLGRTLNARDISFIVQMAHFHVTKRTELIANKEARLLKKDIKCEEAQLYFIDKMCQKEIFDIYERKIIIPERALDCFYKDEITGRHKIAPEYYRTYRARRLPWVIPTLLKSNEIYMLNKPRFKCIEYFYVSTFKIPYEFLDEEDSAVEKYHTNYFIVMARRKYDLQELTFETEYPMFDYFDLLQYIEKWQRYEQ